MKEKAINLQREVEEKIKKSTSLKEVNELKVLYLGKKGPVNELTSYMRDLRSEEKKEFGKTLNDLKNNLNSLFEEKIKYYEEEELNKKLASEQIDISLPATKIPMGAPNILEKVIEEVSLCLWDMMLLMDQK